MSSTTRDTVADIIVWRCPECGKVETDTGQRKRYCGATRRCTRTSKSGIVSMTEMDRWEYGPLRRVR